MWTHDIEVTPGDIRRAWGAVMAGENPLTDRQSATVMVSFHMEQWRSEHVNEWTGVTGAVMDHRLNHGFAVDAADVEIGGGQTDFTVPVMLRDEEEGDLSIEDVIGGEDAYRVVWQDVEAPKSLTIRACIGMHAGTSAEVLGDYMTWLLKVVDAAVNKGYAPTVELWVGLKGCFQRFKSERMRVLIPLVKAGEMIDVDSWRAYLTPGAFRTLGFLAIGLAADRTKGTRRLTMGMGSPTNQEWGVELDDGVLYVECPGGSDRFPEQWMNERLEAVGV
jgi:hypothetical protein